MNFSRLRELINSHVFPIILILFPSSFFFPKLIFSNVLVIILTTLWLFKGALLIRLRVAFKNKTVLLFISTYLIYALCLFYTENLEMGLFLLEKRAPILLFPIIISTEVLSERLSNRILFSFVFSCFIATILAFGSAGKFHLQSLESFSVYLFRESIIEFLNLGTPYLALYITFSIIIIVFFLLKYWSVSSTHLKLSISLLLVYFLALEILLSSRMSLLFLLIFIGTGCLYFFIKHRLVGILILVATISTLTYIYSAFPFINDRFKEISQTEWSPPIGIYYNSTNLRIGIWSCCVEILNQNWLFGLGTGDVQKNLDACYLDKGYSEVMYVESYSTHNEYFNMWLNTGLLGLIILLISLLFPLKISVQLRNYTYLTFLVLIILCFTTEAILERQKGIIFYAFFNSLLAFSKIGINPLTKKG